MNSYFNVIAKSVIWAANPNMKKALSKVSEYSEPSVSTVTFLFFIYFFQHCCSYIRLPISFISLMSLQSRYDGTQQTTTKEIDSTGSYFISDVTFHCFIVKYLPDEFLINTINSVQKIKTDIKQHIVKTQGIFSKKEMKTQFKTINFHLIEKVSL